MPKNPEKILVGPHVTEKAFQKEGNKYVFKVHPEATKPQIKKAVKETYEVEVKKVNTANMPRKKKGQRGRKQGHKPGFKKAVVTLKGEQRIDLLER